MLKTESDQKYYHSDNVEIYKVINLNLWVLMAYNYCNEDDSCIGFNYLTYYVYDEDNDDYSNENKPSEIEWDNNQFILLTYKIRNKIHLIQMVNILSIII